MKSKVKVTNVLNQMLLFELTSINQYFLHARIYKNWGLSELNEKEYDKSILDMKQADRLIERILFLEALPNLQMLGKLRIGEHTQEMLQCDKEFEQEHILVLRKAIYLCEEEYDYVSRIILEKILEEEEKHLDWIEAQEYLIGTAGLHNYQQAMMEN